MNIKRWQKPNSEEVRYYFDLKFSGYRFGIPSLNQALSGSWIAADADGNARIYRKACGGTVCFELRWVDQAFFGEGAAPSFAAWEAAFAACLTAGGNFSEAKWGELDMAAFQLAEAA